METPEPRSERTNELWTLSWTHKLPQWPPYEPKTFKNPAQPYKHSFFPIYAFPNPLLQLHTLFSTNKDASGAYLMAEGSVARKRRIPHEFLLLKPRLLFFAESSGIPGIVKTSLRVCFHRKHWESIRKHKKHHKQTTQHFSNWHWSLWQQNFRNLPAGGSACATYGCISSKNRRKKVLR